MFISLNTLSNISPILAVFHYNYIVFSSLQIAFQSNQKAFPSGGSIQFPLAISPSGSRFTILRTLYTIVERDAEARIYTASLPLHLHSSAQHFWTISRTDSECYESRSYPRLHDSRLSNTVYIYWILFDEMESDICAVEQVRACSTRLTVYRTPNTTVPSQSCDILLIAESQKLLKPFGMSSAHQPSKEFKLAFHPTLPVIAIAGYAGIFVWSYTAGKCCVTL